MSRELTTNQTGNFLIRLGFFTGCLADERYREWLIDQGATDEQVDDALDAVMKLANCFYQGRVDER
jgi:hypothetical protein